MSIYFDPQAPDIVRKSYFDSEIQAEEERKENAFNRLALLQDNWTELLESELRNRFSLGTFSEVRKSTNTAHNIFKVVITRVSKIYNRPPKRIFTGNQADIDLVNKLYKQMKINQKWKKINRYLNAVNDVILQVVWRNDNVDVDIITPNIVSVVQNPEDPTLVEALMIEKQSADTVTGEGKTIAYWSDAKHFLMDENHNAYSVPGNEGRVNPYDTMPFIYIHKQIPDVNFWDETSGSDLYEAALIVGLRNTLLDYYSVWNSFKQLAVVSQDPLPEGITLDPSTAIQTTSQGGSIQVLDFQANFAQLRDDLKAFAGGLLNNYGLSMDAWNQDKPTEYSGKALRIKNEFLEELWQDQIQVFKDSEIELFNMIKFIYEFHTGKSLNCELVQIKFPPIVAYYDALEQLNIDVSMVKANLIDAAVIYAKYHEIEDVETAREEMLEIAKKNADFADTGYTMKSGFSNTEVVSGTTNVDDDEYNERIVDPFGMRRE